MASLDLFLKTVEGSKETAVRRLVEAHKAVSIAAYQMVAADTRATALRYGSPVWSGRYRASHTIAVGAPDTRVKPPHPDTAGPGATRWPDDVSGPYGAPPVSYAAQVVGSLKPFQVVYIANALPYARRIEAGHSRLKAPEGVYEVTAQALRLRFANLNGVTLQ